MQQKYISMQQIATCSSKCRQSHPKIKINTSYAEKDDNFCSAHEYICNMEARLAADA
jgi:hypothetical protein